MAANGSGKRGGDAGAGKLVTTWRTVQKLDADAWRKLRDDAPFRLVRWLAAIGVILGTWDASGNPQSAVAWLPALGVVFLLLLPDADSFGFGGITWKARREADRAEDARKQVEQVVRSVNVGTRAGETAGDTVQARSASAAPAGQALSEFLE
jgi:hypothetical protein